METPHWPSPSRIPVTGAILVMVKTHDYGNCGYSLALLSHRQLTRGVPFFLLIHALFKHANPVQG
jgi:hypothetical protein